ncbi:MAG TPA: hypothetical protein VIG63_05005 [Savagea sp.]
MFKKKGNLFCTSCKIEPTDSVEDMEKKLYPRFCIGHVGLIATGLLIVGFELFIR